MKFTRISTEQAFLAFWKRKKRISSNRAGEENPEGKEKWLIRPICSFFARIAMQIQRSLRGNSHGNYNRELEKNFPASDLYESNKAIMIWVRMGFPTQAR